MALALELRLLSAELPGARDVARRITEMEAKAAAMREVAAQGLEGQAFVQKAYERFEARQGTPAFLERARALTLEAKETYRDPAGIPYLPGTDPYRWLRRARNVAARGSFGESVHQGRAWNELTGVPDGCLADGNLQALTVGWMARASRALGGPSLEKINYWSPIFVCLLSIALVVLIGLRLAGLWGGLFAGVLLAWQPHLAQRTTAGYADTDSWNLLLSLLVAWLLMEALRASRPRQAVGLAGAAGAATGIFAWSWPGWWFYFDVFLAALGATLLIGAILWRPAGSGARTARSRAGAEVSDRAEVFDGARKVEGARKSGGEERSSHPGSRMRLALVALVAGVFVAASGIAVTLLSGGSRFAGCWREPMAALGMLASTVGETWPNPYATVAELKPTVLGEVIGQRGSAAFLAIGLTGVLLTLAAPGPSWLLTVLPVAFFGGMELILPGRREQGLGILIVAAGAAIAGGLTLGFRRRLPLLGTALILAAWILAGLIASSRGNRFLLALVPPLALTAGALLGHLTRVAVAWAGWHPRRSAQLHSELKQPRLARIGALVLLVASIGATLWALRAESGRGLQDVRTIPSMNDSWSAGFDWLRQNSNPRSLVCAWWDYGDMVTQVAARRVLFDAGSQVSSTAYWVARALVTEDPDEARDVLRMVCLGGHHAFDDLRRAGLSSLGAVTLLGEVARVDSSERPHRLAQAGVAAKAAQQVIEAFQREPPEAYLWLTEDLTWKIHAWARFGLWDFRRAALLSRAGELPREAALAEARRLGFGAEEARILVEEMLTLTAPGARERWIAPTPLVSQPLLCVPQGGALISDVGSRIPAPPAGGSGVMRGATRGSIAIYRRRGETWAVVLPPQLSNSLYARLMYEAPRGFGSFEMVWESFTILGDRAALYRIRW